MSRNFDLIGLFVDDLQSMVSFYQHVLCLAIEWDGKGPYAEFHHQGIRFAMYERKQLAILLGQEPSYPRGLNGSFELAINVGTPEQVDRMFNSVVHAGARPIYAPRNEPWKMRSAMVADPEGNLIEIASDFWD